MKTCLHRFWAKLPGLLAIGFLILWALTVSADEHDQIQDIHWLKMDVPPVGITTGPLAGKGIHGGIITALLGQSPRDENVELHANIARLFLQVQSDNYCIPGLIKNAEREKFLYFSERPSARIASSHLIYARNNQKLREHLVENVSLEALLKSGFVAGVGAKVSYSAHVDEILQKYGALGGVVYHPAPNFIEPMILMIEKKRMDFFLAPPWAITWRFVKQGGELRDGNSSAIATHPFREISTKMNYYAACSRSRWGKEMIGLLDQRLARKDVQKALTHNAEVWTSVESAMRQFSE